jgi:D-alanyl-D-alanine dipeptidase
MPLSGPTWVSQFPNSKSPDSLVEPFRTDVKGFLTALKNAGATVSIADTLRPPERAYLMHFAFSIARENLDPAAVPAKAGVDIQWVHPATPSVTSAKASQDAAEKMVQAYGIAFKPALGSRHTEGRAIDMSIAWIGDLVIAKADGTSITVTSAPRSGDNSSLQHVGASYGVIKLVSDPPHWSNDGH